MDGFRATPTPATSLEQVRGMFERYLYLPDPTPLYAVLATVLANRMADGDPVWLIVVAGSSRGKTEIVVSVVGLEDVRLTGKLTEPALLSGTSSKERAKNAKGGILKEVGERGILVVKDLGAILSMHRDSRAEVLQALRDIFDGRYSRDVGVDGGKRLEWDGHLGLIGAATTALDRHHAVLTALGERWLTVRIAEAGEQEMVRLALKTKDTAAMRATLRDVVSSYFAGLGSAEIRMRELDEDEENLIVSLSSLVCRARSPVDRDAYSREIVLVHDSEGPVRIARQLQKLTCAFGVMGLDRETIWRTVTKIGLDSIPSPRREALLHLLEHGEKKTAELATLLDLPTRTTERAIEELVAHGLLTRGKAGEKDNAANVWRPSATAREFWEGIGKPPVQAKSDSPEMSEDHLSNSSDSTFDDKTGELGSSSPAALTGSTEDVDADEIERLAAVWREEAQAS